MMKLRCVLTLALVLPWVVVQASPDIQSWKTERGARVLFVQAPELPMVDIRVVFDAGSARDGATPGIAALMLAVIDQGAGGLSADEIARGFEDRGANIGGGSERDMTWLSLRSLTDAELLEPSLDLFAKVLQAPDFPEEDFRREQQRTLIALQYQQQKPGTIASRQFYESVFGKHPYAIDTSGTSESVKKLTAEDLDKFYRRYFVASNATVAIVGDVDRKQAEAIAARLVDALPAGKPPEPLPKVAQIKQAKEVFIDHPSTQSHVLMGAPGMHRGDPDYFPLYVGNHILGGSGLVSRISNEIREKRGLAYSAYSYFVPLKQDGPYTLGFQTRNDQREEAIEVLRDTLESFIKEGPSEEELAASRNNIIGGFPLRVSSNSKIIEYLAVIGFYGLPLDYLERFPKEIEAVSTQSIKSAFSRRVHPDRMVTVVVGEAGEDPGS